MVARLLPESLRRIAHTDRATRLAYATDASVYRMEPEAVIVAVTLDDVHATLAFARSEGVPITPRGAGTSLAGQAIGRGVSLDLSRLARIAAFDPQTRRVIVEPGVVQADLEAFAATHGLTYGPDTATAGRATIGGMVGNDSAGMRSLVYGRTSHRIARLRVLHADGTDAWIGSGPVANLRGAYAAARAILAENAADAAVRYPKLLRCVDGYNLPALGGDEPNAAGFFCGSEGTLGLVLEAEVQLDPRPAVRGWTIVALASYDAVGDATLALLATSPSAVEMVGTDVLAGESAADALSGGAPAVLMVEHQGTREAVAAARAAIGVVPGAVSIRHVDDTGAVAQLVAFRRSLQGLVVRQRQGERVPITVLEDGAVPVDRLGSFLGALRDLFAQEGTASVLYGHASVGCIHARPLLDLSDREDRARFRRIAEQGADLILAHGGALSGEHGDGILRAELLPRMFGNALCDAFRDVKRVFDPDGILNPGKIIDAPPLDENFRAGSAPRRRGVIEQDASLCIGVGACLERRAGTMCPPYRVTRRETHATRGRADLLREAMSGSISLDDPGVSDALATCVGCKACQGECPVGVDVAWLKSQALAVRYRDGAPRRERMIANLPVMLGRAARAPRLANAANRSVAGVAARRMLGFHSDRPLPVLAARRLREASTPVREPREAGCVVFVDTFSDFLEPEIGRAALAYLEASGARPVLAPNVCCGRTYLSSGFVDDARALAQENTRRLAPFARAGLPIIGLEPSCLGMLRDELVRLCPDDPDARLVAEQAVLFDEAAARLDAPALDCASERVVIHPHCHAKAMGAADATREAVCRVPGVDAVTLDAGCCGMAGSFGYRREQYDLSVAIGESRLAPAVRDAAGAVIVANGTSCRAQISDLTGVRALHPAQYLASHLPRSAQDGLSFGA